MKYAVIKTGGKQYKVAPGDVIEVDKVSGSADSQIVFGQVLLVVSDEKVQIGTPHVPNASVKGKIIEQKKGEKMYVRKFKSKVRYRKTIGFRSQLTKVQIARI